MEIKRIVTGSYAENCYLLINYETGSAFMIDPGDEPQVVIDEVNRLNLKIKAVLITHGHFDHTNSIKTIKEKLNVKIYMNKLDLPLVSDPDAVDEDIKDGDVFTLGDIKVKAIATPGHSMGGMCFMTDNILFSGDTLFEGSIGRTDLQGGDYSQLINSIKSRLLPLPDDTVVYPGHGGVTTIGQEKVYNPFLR